MLTRKFAAYFQNIFFKNTSGWLLLTIRMNVATSQPRNFIHNGIQTLLILHNEMFTCMYSKTQTRWQFLFLFAFSFVYTTSNWPFGCERCICTFFQHYLVFAVLSYFCLFLERRANLRLTSLIIYYELWVKEAILLRSKCTCLLLRRKPLQQNCWYFHKHFKLTCAL